MSRFSNIGLFAKAVAHAAANPNQIDGRLIRAAAGLNTITPSEGGFLVPSEQAKVLLTKATTASAILSRVGRVVPDEASGQAFIPTVAETSRANGSRYGGLSIAWLEQGASITPSKPLFGQLDLRRKRCAGVVIATDDMLRADPETLTGYLEPLFSEALADALAAAVVDGTGAGQPLGLLRSPSKITVTRSGSNVIAASDVRGMVSRLWGGSYPTAAWLCSESCMGQLLALAGSLLTFDGGMRLAGFPVVPSEYCEVLGTSGDIVLTDLSEYQLSTSELQIAFSEHLGFENAEGYYRLTINADGCLAWQTAVTPRNGGDTLSPVVVLS